MTGPGLGAGATPRAAVIPAGAGWRLSLPGRAATELVSAAEGGHDVTVRRVRIAPAPRATAPPTTAPPTTVSGAAAPATAAGGALRGPHRHGCTEVIAVLAGAGQLDVGDDTWPVRAGDVMVVPPGEPHRTRNTGEGDLALLCFFPVPDLAAVTSEGPPASQPGPATPAHTAEPPHTAEPAR